MKLSKKRLAQIIKEEYQRFQENQEERRYSYDALRSLGRTVAVALSAAQRAKGDPVLIYKIAAAEVESFRERAELPSRAEIFQSLPPKEQPADLMEQEQTVGAGIEDISADDVLGNQPGSPFPVGSQEAFTQVFTKFRKRDGTLDYAKMMEVYENLDEKNKKEFVEFILRNPLIFNNMKQSDVDFALDLDPDAPLNIDMSDYEQGAPESKEEEEEDMDSIVKDIQRLMKDPRSTS